MKRQSHRRLGEYLAREYMAHCPKRYIRAFLFGCIEPDQNPATYLKGSIRYQWLRGHNYLNAKRYLLRLSKRLECRGQYNLLDYYAIGKLIHYLADAFTSAHNDTFPSSLELHKAYEATLQHHFLDYLSRNPIPSRGCGGSVAECILSRHALYRSYPTDIHTDTYFAFSTCCCVTSALLEKKAQSSNNVDFPLALFHHPWYNVRSLNTWRLFHDDQQRSLLL